MYVAICDCKKRDVYLQNNEGVVALVVCCHNSKNLKVKRRVALIVALFYLRNIPLCHIFADDILRPLFPTVGMYYFDF